MSAAESADAGLALSLRIDGMTCASCVGRVERALRAVPDVRHVGVNLVSERADLVLASPTALDAVVAAIEKAGYKPETETVALTIEGLSCASCVGRAEKALKKVPGVLAANVNLAAERGEVTHLAGTASMAELEEAVTRAGYPAHRILADAPLAPATDRHAEEARGLMRAALLAALLTLPVFAVEMGAHLVPALHHALADVVLGRIVHVAEFILTAAVLFGPGRRFFQKGIPALWHGAPDMNALVALGAGAAFLYSSLATFAPDFFPAGTAEVYFEAAAVIVTLILVGRSLEARARGRTGAAIQSLVALQPATAVAMRQGALVETPIAQILPGDTLLVRPGTRIALDGVITEGASFVDESMLTGEAQPVAKSVSAKVVGGTLNLSGSFAFKVTEVGAETVLARIIRMVEAAQGAKLPIQALADKVTAWFVPAVMALAAVTFLIWLVVAPAPALGLALTSMVAVLIIACPCAMGLATPTSIMVGTGRAAELGILFRQGAALQPLQDVKIIGFDKTGTLTQGRPELTDVFCAPGFARDEVVAWAAAVEARSEHPIAKAIMAAAPQGAASALEEFSAIAGLGVTARLEGRAIAIGADRLMTKLGIDVSAFSAEAQRLAEAAKTPIYVAINDRMAALLAVADPLKPSSVAAIAALHAQGLEIVMITGDQRGTAEAIAKAVGIDKVVAEVLPEGKVEALKALRTDDRKLAFVGDGINDAPALAAADVGIAIGTGTDIAIQSADVILMSGDLSGIATAIALSRATMRNIRQNLFWALAYNVILIPVAAGALYKPFGVLLSPMLAAGAMAFSSVFVLTNALRLRRFKPVLQNPGAAAQTHAHDALSQAPAE